MAVLELCWLPNAHAQCVKQNGRLELSNSNNGGLYALLRSALTFEDKIAFPGWITVFELILMDKGLLL